MAMLGSGRIYMGLEEAKAMEMDQSETWNEVGGATVRVNRESPNRRI